MIEIPISKLLPQTKHLRLQILPTLHGNRRCFHNLSEYFAREAKPYVRKLYAQLFKDVLYSPRPHGRFPGLDKIEVLDNPLLIEHTLWHDIVQGAKGRGVLVDWEEDCEGERFGALVGKREDPEEMQAETTSLPIQSVFHTADEDDGKHTDIDG